MDNITLAKGYIARGGIIKIEEYDNGEYAFCNTICSICPIKTPCFNKWTIGKPTLPKKDLDNLLKDYPEAFL